MPVYFPDMFSDSLFFQQSLQDLSNNFRHRLILRQDGLYSPSFFAVFGLLQPGFLEIFHEFQRF